MQLSVQSEINPHIGPFTVDQRTPKDGWSLIIPYLPGDRFGIQ